MQKIIVLLLLLLIGGRIKAQTLVNAKGTKIPVDTSKWLLSGADIYNKNTGTIGIGTNGAANADAALEIKATDKGLLVPRIALTDITASDPLSEHVAGMMVYNTANAGSAPDNVVPGFYYNNGARWIQVADPSMQDLRLIDDNNHITQDAGTDGEGTSVGTGTGNIGIGKNTLASNTTGYVNTAVGTQALNKNTDGYANAALGQLTLLNNNTGYFNTAVGVQSMTNNTSGTQNTAVGGQSGQLITTGTNNTTIGYNTGRGITTGANNTVVGANVTGLSANLSNNIIIADGQGNQRMRVIEDGSVGVATTTPRKTLHVNGSLQITNELNVGGDAATAGSAGTSGQVLTSGGANTAPAWTTLAPPLGNVTSISGATTLTDADYYVIATGNSTYTVTLPAPTAANKGKVYYIKSVGTSGSKTTNASYITYGGTSSALPNNTTTMLVSDGTTWQMFGRFQ